MQIKKILGILLAFCFLMSVTAAAVSAAPDNVVKTDKDKQKINDDKDKNKDKDKDKDKNKDKDRDKNIDKYHRGKWVPGHWEIKFVKTIVKQKVFVDHHWKIITKVVYKPVKVWVPGKMVYSH